MFAMSPLAVPENPSELMPRRQSCDRCHEQKVRCFTTETHCSMSQDDYDVVLPQDGRYISPNPCYRCKRARSACVYSPQQRSGRPRLPRDALAAPLPVRRRRVSRRSSSSASRSPTSSPSSSPSIPPPANGTPGISTWTPPQLYQQQPFGSQVPSHFTEMSALHGAQYYSSGGAHLPQPQIINSDWPSLPPQGAPYSSAQSSHLPWTNACTTIPLSTPFILKSNANPQLMSNTRSHQHAAPEPTQPWSHDSPATNSYLEQLTEINVRLYQVSQTMASLPSFTASSSLPFPPTINEICNTATSLADLTERYSLERAAITTVPLSSFDFNTATGSSSAAINSAMDASICLTILSSHQSVLGAFEDLCSCFLIWLSQANMMGIFETRSSETTAQIVSVTNLLGHLLQRLEHSLRPLDMDIDPSLALLQPPSQPTDYDQQINDASGSGLSTTAGGAFAYPDRGAYHGPSPHEYPPSSGGQEIYAATPSSIFNQLEEKQNRVKAQMKAIRRCMRKSGENGENV